MSAASDAFYQSAKGGLAMRLNNAEQLAQGREGLLTAKKAQELTLDDDLEHARANRDVSIFGMTLGGSGAVKTAYGIGKAIGGKYLDRGLARLQSAVDDFRNLQPQPEGYGAQVEDSNGVKFDPSTLDMTDPENPKLFPPEQTPNLYAQTNEVARDGYGNRFDPSQVDTSSYDRPVAAPKEEQPISEEGIADAPIDAPPPEPTLDADTAQQAGDVLRSAGRPSPSIMTDAQQARLNEIRGSDPILTEDNVGSLKKMGIDMGDLTPDEVDTGARMILGDTAVEGLSSALGVAGSVLGAAVPVVGTIADLVGIGFAAKGLFDSADAAAKEATAKEQLTQSIAQTNIPVQVQKQGSAPVMDSSTNRVGGFLNY
jgi:hypothetical protein